MSQNSNRAVLRGGAGTIPELPPFEVYEEDLGTMCWEDAVTACHALTVDGGGWRLPTILELRFMYRVCELCRKEYSLSFTAHESYWAQGPDPHNPREDGAAALYFATYEPDSMAGYYTNFPKDRDFRVRCVRTVAQS